MSAVLEKIDKLGSAVNAKVDAFDKKLADLNATVTKHHDALSKTLIYPDGKGPGSIFARPRDRKEEGQWGYKSLNHQLREIRGAAANPQKTQELTGRLAKSYESWIAGDPEAVQKAAALGLNESVGDAGGFLLAPTFAEGILEILHAEEDLLQRCDKYEMASASLKVRAIDETSRVDGSRWGGVLGYWLPEAGNITASQPKFRLIELVPHKLATLFYATDELMADGGGMLEQMTSRLMAKEINFQVSTAIFNGTGAGQPLGLLNSSALIAVSKRTGQAAATVITENVQDMWARLHSSARKNAVWFCHQDVEPSLNVMSLPVGIGGALTYLPPGGVSEKPYGSLMGRPVIVTEYNQTLGTQGDLILADLKAYIAATRGTVQAASSMHVQFLTDQTAYRLTYRVAGQPWWYQALTPYKGSNTQSPYIALATRA